MPIKITTTDSETTQLIQKLNKIENGLLVKPLLSFLEKKDIQRLNQDDDLLKLIIKNIKEKKEAFENLNEKKLNEILKEEIDFLESSK